MKYLYTIFNLSLLLSNHSLLAQATGFDYYQIIMIDGTKIVGDEVLTNFPFYFTYTDPSMRYKDNSGDIQNENGYDIVFYDGANKLNHQIDYYNPVSGEFSSYINIPSLDKNNPPVITMYYGKSSVTTSLESNSTWSSEYETVSHFDENTGVSNDDTGGGNNGSISGGVNLTSGSSGNGLEFDGIDDYVCYPDQNYSNGTNTGFTISFMFNVADLIGTNFQYLFSHGGYGVANSINVYFIEDGYLADPSLRGILRTVVRDSNDGLDVNNLDIPAGLADGNWHEYTLVQADGMSGLAVYIDGVKQSEDLIRGGDITNPSGKIFIGTREDLNADRYASGVLDELRIQNVQRSADWISTEYNNKANPNSFFSISGAVLPIELASFNIENIDDHYARINWSTYSEKNNDYFEVYRSKDLLSWELISSQPGAGNSFEYLEYSCNDLTPFLGTSYYKLKQIDYDGKFTYSNIESFYLESGLIKIYPNPATNGYINLFDDNEIDPNQLIIYNSYGDIFDNYSIIKINRNYIQVTFYDSGVFQVYYDQSMFKIIVTEAFN